MTTSIQEAFNKTAMFSIGESSSAILSNVMQYVDELNKLAPRNGFFAINAITSQIGYALCNQLLWDYRRKSQAIALPAPTIDIFNDEASAKAEETEVSKRTLALGLPELPRVNALPLTGAYKMLLRLNLSNQLSKDFPAQMPHEVIHRLQSPENPGLDAAYADMQQREISNNAAARAIRQAMSTIGTKIAASNEARNKAEADHVLREIQSHPSGELTDATWEDLPVYFQYKMVYAVQRQAIKAYAYLMSISNEIDDTASRLGDLINTMQLELEAAAATAEVKLAFTLERMGSAEDVTYAPAKIKSESKPEVKDEPKAVGPRRRVKADKAEA